MSVTVIEQDEGKTLVINILGKLTRSDYDRFVPQIERLIDRHGKISFVVNFQAFEGIEAGALWEDVKFDVKHFNDIERVAIIGEDRWTEWMTTFCKPFTTAEVRFFTPERYREAEGWVSAGVTA